MNTLATLTQLTGFELLLGAVVVFVAGVVRGFSGFALSALVMSSLVVFIPPIELIAVCWMLELSAGLLMVRGGLREWDKPMVLRIAGGSFAGWPVGLYLTNYLPAQQSKILALMLISVLALLQLLKVRARFLATDLGTVASGFMAGVATGIASVGGMVVALYVLATEAPAALMRGSLVMYLVIGSVTGFIFLMLYGMLDTTALVRGAFAVPLCLAGVALGTRLFRPSLEKYYRPFCLCLLLALAAAGLLRMALTG
ncbi:MAG: sulfite exporter TauE/SafE family protein [Pseudomonadota bacterium]